MIEELKGKLNELVAHSSITNFEGEDIIELIEEGESVEWILGQLKGNSPDLDEAAFASLLAEIKSLVKPAELPGGSEAAIPEGDEGRAIEENLEVPDLSGLDLSRIDLSRIVDELPPGMELPPGVDLEQIKELMESPQGKIMSDFLLFCQEKGVDLNEGNMNDPRIQKLQQEWMQSARAALDGRTPAEMMHNDSGLMPGKIETYRREEPRVGRNDPCPCGSGKKFKKCCGKA